MAKLVGPAVQYPARVSFASYIAVIVIGAALLLHPACRTPGTPPLSMVDALFTATSATCVTGLTVRSTQNDFTVLGQFVILLLIQFGGIGIMTITTYVTLSLGGRTNLRRRAVISETLGASRFNDLRWVLRNVLTATLIIEGIGILLLTIRNLPDMAFSAALWHATFHGISAYCNAGFGLLDASLMPYRADLFLNIVIASLIIVGGIGFPVILDVLHNWHGEWFRRWDRLQVHSKFMIIGTTVLLIAGAVATLVLEWDGVLRELPFGERIIAACFHSVTTRTAGFNTLEIAELTNATLFITIILMMIGAGPCSTGGGVKVSTLSVMVIHGWTSLRGMSHANLFRRTIPTSAFEKANATTLAFGGLVIAGLIGILMFEQSGTPHSASPTSFLEALFEVVSALATVGLSTGITPRLSDPAKAVIILLMIVGRLGPISVLMAVSAGEKGQPVEFPNEEPLMG